MAKNNISHLTPLKIILIIIILGFLIYSNSLFNSFFADDYHQIVDSTRIHSLDNIPSYFYGSTFYSGGTGLTGNYYKPIMATAYSLLYSLFGINPAGYHFVQVLLHLANAIMVFLLIRIFFKPGIAFTCALIFLTHPINNETVVYIANLQDTLFLFFGLLALIINIKSSFVLKRIIVSLLLLFSLLSKETGLLFLFILPLATLLFQKKYWLRDSSVSIFVFTLYCVLRFALAHIYFNTIITAPIMMLSLSERILHIPYIIFFYFKTFFFPDDLSIFHASVLKSLDFNNFYLPLLINTIFFLLLFIAGVVIYRKAHHYHYLKIYTFFLVWFLIGLTLHLQLFPLDGTVADRWFYFPIIGILGIIGIFTELFWRKYHNSEIIKSYSITILTIIIVIFSLRVMVRNTNWVNQLTLIGHDIQYNHDSYQLEEGYGLELMKLGKFDEAYPHLLRSTQIFPGVYNLTSLGTYYANTKQFDKAKVTFEKAMQYDDLILTYENYGLLLLLTGDMQKTKLFTTSAVKKFPSSYRLWIYLAISLYALGHDKEALQAVQKSHALNPRPASEYVLSTIKDHKKIDLSKL